MGPTRLFRLPETRLTGFVPDTSPARNDLLEVISSGNRRLRALAENAGRSYIHLIHVGAGWAMARLRRTRWRGIGHPMLRWLAWDGWGFHQAYFNPRRVFHDHWIERGARGATRSIRDQGTGRALWFRAGADPGLIARLIGEYPQHRRSDLWAGIGLAGAYTGMCHPLGDLLAAGAGYRPHLAQGAAFAAKAHVLSGHVPPGATRGTELLTGVSPHQAAEWTDQALARIPRHDSPHDYERWRAEIRGTFEQHAGGVLQ
jgi:hypothetical protein